MLRRVTSSFGARTASVVAAPQRCDASAPLKP